MITKLTCRMGVMVLAVLMIPVAVEGGVRCGGRLVEVGDTRYDARKACGEPDHIESWEEERVLRDYRYPGTVDDGIYRRSRTDREPLVVTETTEIEVWTYDWGPHRLIHYLRFENGRLTEIETGGYGN